MISKINIVLILLFGSYALSSQEQISLQEAIEKTLVNNYDIRLVEKDLEIAQNNVSVGNAGFLPSINATGSYGYSFEDSRTVIEQGTFPGEDNESTSLNGTVALDWTLFDGFAMFKNYEKFSEIEELNEVRLQLEMENRLQELFDTYFQAVRLNKNIELLNEAAEYSDQRLEYLNTSSQFGSATNLEILRAEVDYNTDMSNLSRTQVQLNTTLNRLKFIMGEVSTQEYELTTDIELEELSDYNSLKERAFTQNTSVQQAIKNKEISETDKDLVEAAYYPRLDFRTSYSYSETSSQKGFIRESFNRGVNVSLNASWNLFDGFKTRIREENAEITIQRQEVLVERVKAIIEMNLMNSFQSYTDLKEILTMEEENLETARINFERSQELYNYGNINSLELRESQLNFLRTEQRILDLKYEIKTYETQLKLLSGQLGKITE